MSTVGAVLLLLGFLFCGEAVLVATGLVSGWGDGSRAAAMAVFTGWATTTLALALLAAAGQGPTLVAAGAVWLAVLAVAAARVLLRPPVRVPRPALRERTRAPRLVALLGQVALAGWLAVLAVRAWEPTGVLHADTWNQWLPKAIILHDSGVDTSPGGLTDQFNPDYPLLHPIGDALYFRALGSVDPLDLPRLHWAVAACFLLGVAWLLAPRVRPAILWPSLAMLALTPRVGSLVGSLLADETAAMLVAMAGLTGLLWLLERDRRYVPLTMVFLAGAVLAKNEGLMLALVIVVALALTPAGRREWRLVGLLGVVVLVTRRIWKQWLLAHDVPRNPFYDLTDFLDPGYMLDRVDRLDYALTRLLDQFGITSRWLLLVPAALVLALLLARRLPTVTVFVCAVVVLDVLGFAAVYWISPWDLTGYVDNTVDRLPAYVVVLCGALFPLLLQESLAPATPSQASPP